MHTFTNWSKMHQCTPAAFYQPESEEEILQILSQAKASGKKVKVVGGGHSWSDAACTDGYLINLDKMNRLDTTPQGQVLLAELITEAVCREIARHGVEEGKFLAPEGAEADAIQNHFIRLQNRYAHVIHDVIVKLD